MLIWFTGRFIYSNCLWHLIFVWKAAPNVSQCVLTDRLRVLTVPALLTGMSMHRWRSHWYLLDFYGYASNVVFSNDLSSLYIFWNNIPYQPAFSVNCFVLLFLSDFSVKHGLHATVNEMFLCVLCSTQSMGTGVEPVWQCDHSYKCSSKFRVAFVDVFSILAQLFNCSILTALLSLSESFQYCCFSSTKMTWITTLWCICVQ